MHGPATERYLETEVLTAPAQKLQLMLIDAAIRSTMRAQRHFEADAPDEACESLIHAQKIVTELLSGLNHEIDAPLARKVASVYLFIFRRLMEANVERDSHKLDDALRVLQVERDTWAEVCREVGTAPPNEGEGLDTAPTRSASPVPPPFFPGLTHDEDDPDRASQGLSLEA